MVRKPTLASLFAISLGIVSPANAFESVDHTHQALSNSTRTVMLPLGKQIIRPQLSARPQSLEAMFNSRTRVRVFGVSDQRSGAARVLQFHNIRAIAPQVVTREMLVSAVNDFVEDNQQSLKVEKEELFIKEGSLLIAKDIQSLTYGMRREGIEVADSNLTFHFKNGEIVQVINNLFAEAVTAAPHKYNEARLQSYAKSVLMAQRISKTGEFFRVKEAAENEYQLVHVIEFEGIVSDVPYQIQINTADRSVFEVSSKYLFANGQAAATIYPRWYNESPAAMPLKELQITKGVYSDDNGAFTINDTPSAVNMVGQRVKVNFKKSPIALQPLNTASGDWILNFERNPNEKLSKDVADDRLTSQAMIYYHATEIAKLAEKYIPQTAWLKKPLEANANVGGFLGLMSCNAYWDRRSINFYKGSGSCANTGLIADVIYHEWGHGLDQNTGGIDDMAFSEGIGDIMAMIITESNQLGIGFHKKNFAPVRDLEPNAIYKKGIGGLFGEPHAQGLIIGSTFWDLYKYLIDAHGHEKALDMIRNFAFKMVYTAPRYTDVYNALLVIDDNDASVANGTPNLCVINKAFSEHGLATKAAGCI